MKQTYLITIILVFSISAFAQWSVLESDQTDKKVSWNLLQEFTQEAWNASNFASEKDLEWFKDAKYGMFIHFGLSSYVEKDLSWGMCYTRKAPDKGNGPYPDSVWTTWPKFFEFDKFDAKEWVEIAKKAGMKYIVTIAKHHDGFHMWDTQYSDFKVTNTPFGRDYLKEIAEACHDAGMKFGIYYSQRDWYHPDYAPVDPELIDVIPGPPYFKAKPGKTVKAGQNHKKYIDYQFNVVKELCSNYGKIDVFWFDACWWGGMFTAEMWDSERLTRMIRELQPGIIINNRASIPGDFDTPEQKIGMYQSPRPWESCVTLCDSWSWSPTPTKSTKKIIEMITATASGNGNILVSWGPKWDGAFDPVQVDRLAEVGEWLSNYGHSIYNTNGGPWYPEEWGGSTYSGKKAFIHLRDDKTNKLVLQSIDNPIISIKSLNGEEVKFRQSTDNLTIKLEPILSRSGSRVFEIIFKNEIKGMVNKTNGEANFTETLANDGPIESHKDHADQALKTLQKWYKESTGLWETTSWWNAANAITAIIDYSRITGSEAYLNVIENTFEKCKKFEVEMPDPQDNWVCTNFINDYYDDEGWWILAWIAAFDLSGDQKYLEMAKTTFSDMSKGWDEVCGGGVYWKKPNLGKSAVQNELFMLSAIRLHQRSPGTEKGLTYFEWAVRTWEWFKNSGMINEKFQVENGLNKTTCKVNPGKIFTYNQGIILSALIELSKELNEPELLLLAEKIADSAIKYSIYENGILKEPHEPDLNGDASQFKGIFMRHLAYLYEVTGNENYKSFILKNAESIWLNARNTNTNEIGAIWTGPFDKADASRQSSALDAINAAMVIVNDKL